MPQSFRPKPAPLTPDRKQPQSGYADTHVVKRLRPSKPGTLKLTRRYGDALVCVRYRHNAEGTHRYTTVELVVEDAPVASRAHLDAIVLVRLAFDDAKRRHRALAHGAKWDVDHQLWQMPRRTAKKLRLAKRIVNL
jgi:hypothetical protein